MIEFRIPLIGEMAPEFSSASTIGQMIKNVANYIVKISIYVLKICLNKKNIIFTK